MVKTRTGVSTTTEMELTDEFKSYLDGRFEQLLDNRATKDDIDDLKKEVTSLIDKIEEQKDKIVRLESTTSEQEERITVLEAQNAVLESHINHLLSAQEEQEQYSRRLCLRIDGMGLPKKGQNETSEHCLEKVKKIIEEIGVDVPDAVIDRAHRIGPTKKKDGKVTQQIIVRFTTWRHRTAVYRARKNASEAKIRLDLTKRRLNLLIVANEVLKQHKDWYAFADVNCRTRVKIGEKYSSFESKEELEKLISEASEAQ